jgi:hypothetical protein
MLSKEGKLLDLKKIQTIIQMHVPHKSKTNLGIQPNGSIQ